MKFRLTVSRKAKTGRGDPIKKTRRGDKILTLISTVQMEICNKLSWGLFWSLMNYKCLASGAHGSLMLEH
jgi:hypothetical protein